MTKSINIFGWRNLFEVRRSLGERRKWKEIRVIFGEYDVIVGGGWNWYTIVSSDGLWN
jgi:hypothetical protein